LKKLAAVLLLLRALPCLAQQAVTSELTGRVASARQSLPGVTVTLTSDSLQGSRVAVTGENGGYLFALLPPADYLLHFDLQGFSAVEKRVRVALAETTRVDVEMAAAPLRETLAVESDRDRVAEGASIGTHLRAAELQSLPGPRDIRAAVLLSPSAESLNNRLVLAGAPTWDSLFLVDGVVVNENLSGQPHNLFIEDAIQEIAVLTGGIAAEYGRFTGGVVSTLTKSGGNEFSGSLRDTVTNGAWTSRLRSTRRTKQERERSAGFWLRIGCGSSRRRERPRIQTVDSPP
jgi:carboxypeptidase family protein